MAKESHREADHVASLQEYSKVQQTDWATELKQQHAVGMGGEHVEQNVEETGVPSSRESSRAKSGDEAQCQHSRQYDTN